MTKKLKKGNKTHTHTHFTKSGGGFEFFSAYQIKHKKLFVGGLLFCDS